MLKSALEAALNISGPATLPEFYQSLWCFREISAISRFS